MLRSMPTLAAGLFILICLPLLALAMPGSAICAMSSLVGTKSPSNESIIVGHEHSEIDTIDFVSKNLAGRNRIQGELWSLDSNPDVLLLNGKKVFGLFAYNQYGSTFSLPHKTCVIIGPKGNSVDVIAHELVHADIANQMGYFNYFSYPRWLDEGIAMQVDKRPRYDAEALGKTNAAYVTSLRGQEFYSGDVPQVVSNYAAAKLLIKNWVGQNGVESLPTLLDQHHIYGTK